jgi:predicted anti-sigma-YlaC factor YlaD
MNRIQAVFRSLSPTCREAAMRLSMRMDGELSRADRAGLGMHLALCRSCRRCAKQMAALRRMMKRGGEESVLERPVMPQESRHRIERFLQKQIR